MKPNTPLLPLYYDKDVLVKSPEVLYRTQHNGNRYYYTISNNIFKKYPSVTTVLDKVMPTSEYLIKWISQYGWEKAQDIKVQKAQYGTLLHILISQYLVDQKFNADALEAVIATYKYSNNISFDTSSWCDELKKDIYAFHVFAAKYEVEPIAISIMLLSDKLKIAGELDMVIKMRVGTGVNGTILKNDIKVDKSGVIKEDKTRVVTAILDIKSGRHGFYPSNEAQLHLYKGMWDENFPHIPIDALYNWAPKSWNEEPDYTLKEQSTSNESKKIQHYIDLFQIDEDNNPRSKSIPVIQGTFELGKVNGNLKVKSLDSVLEKSIEFLPEEPNCTEPVKIFKTEEHVNQEVTLENGNQINVAVDPEHSAFAEFIQSEGPETLAKINDVHSQLEKLFNS
jgi:hypothetical protein